MENAPIVSVKGLSKKFCKDIHLAMRYTLNDTTRSFLGSSTERAPLREREFWALNDVNFELHRGEALALIGTNGSGKTTLLTMIEGIFEPDQGEITVAGKTTALLKLAAGLHQDYTGRENLELTAAVLGMSLKEIRQKMPSMIDFADIGDFIDSPVKNYSQGMVARLAFSSAVFCQADILLIDEILAVGDAIFIDKCRKKIKELSQNGTSIILASHSNTLTREICQKALWLHQGEVKAHGPLDEVSTKYREFQARLIALRERTQQQAT